MFCITHAETKNQGLKNLLQRAESDLYEIRLDRMTENFNLNLARDFGKNILFTPVSSEGSSLSTELVKTCKEALKLGAAYLKLDSRPAKTEAGRNLINAKASAKAIISFKLDQVSPQTLNKAVEDAKEAGADILSIISNITDAADLLHLLDFKKTAEIPFVITAISWAGELTTIRYKEFGSLFANVCLTPDSAEFEGQKTLEEARGFGADWSPPPILLGVVGGEQVKNSSGYKVYNKLFAARDMNFRYVRLPTFRIADAIELIRQLKFKGLSVTMPHKQEVIKYLDETDAKALRIGAVNNISYERGKLVGRNTDALGVTDALLNKTEFVGFKAAVLGAGGAARAAVCSLVDGGAFVTVYNRTVEKAREIASIFNCKAAPLEEFETAEFDLLLNATSIGMDSEETPVKNAGRLKRKIVLDMVYHPPRTRLIKDAEAAGARAAIPGTEVWLYQGLNQLKLWTELEFSRETLEREIA